MTTVTYDGVITPGRPHKKLVKGGKRFVGRNSAGRITVRHKGADTNVHSVTLISPITNATSPPALRRFTTTQTELGFLHLSVTETENAATFLLMEQ